MQRTLKLVVLLIAGIVGFVGFLVVLILNPTRSVPVKVRLLSYTNGRAVITIRNQTRDSFDYTATVERKIDGKWPFGGEWPSIRHPDEENPYGVLGPSNDTNLTMRVWGYEPYPWRISVIHSRRFKIGRMRNRAGVWCAQHGLFYVSHKLLREGEGENKTLQISTPEMAQAEK